MAQFIIDIPDEKMFAFVGRGRTLLIPYIMAGHKAKHDTGLSLTPYTEPDLERVRKEAYDKGQEDLRKSCVPKDEEAYGIGYNEGFQRGLDLAWDAARKIFFNPDDGGMSAVDVNEVFGENSWTVMKDFSASEVVAKIKEYEDSKQKIKVGDEVKAFEKKPFIVTGFGYGYDEEDVYCHGFVTENGISTSAKKNSCVRTGRHFSEIAAVLEKMKEE